MKRMSILLAALFAITVPLASFAAMDHGGHQGNVAHEEVTDGVKATFRL